MVDDYGPEMEPLDSFNSYRYGRGAGQYLYLAYFIEEPYTGPADIVPLYIGETNLITGRLRDYLKKIRRSFPSAAWTDDGSWGSWSEYDHMATVLEKTNAPLYIWICDVDEMKAGQMVTQPTAKNSRRSWLASFIPDQRSSECSQIENSFRSSGQGHWEGWLIVASIRGEYT